MRLWFASNLTGAPAWDRRAPAKSQEPELFGFVAFRLLLFALGDVYLGVPARLAGYPPPPPRPQNDEGPCCDVLERGA